MYAIMKIKTREGIMKSVKIGALLTIVLACMLLLCSCTCDPAQNEWYIVSVHHDLTYVNGQTIRTTTYRGVHNTQPVGISSDDVNIKFYEDGRVEFKPYGSEILTGDYILKHNGMKNSYFTVTFESGERIDDGYAESYYYGKVVRFSFRGVGYEFSADSDDALTDEELRERTQWLIEDVREADDRYFYRGTVTLTENGGILSSDKLERNIDLFADGIKVTAVHITDNNELVILDELREGECVFAYYESSYSPAVAVYYVDPLPSQTPDGPVEYTAFDIIPELEYYRDNPESTLLKLTREHSPANPAEFNRHIYITNAEDAALWLDRLAEITLTDADTPPADIDGQHTVFVMRFEDKSGENSRVIINYECGMIKRGNKWYSCDSFPAWEGGSDAYSFSCMNSAMYAYGGNVRYPSIAGIEFVPDTKQDYEYPEDHYSIRLEGEVGEITVYDETHFYYNGVYYLITSEKNFYQLYH